MKPAIVLVLIAAAFSVVSARAQEPPVDILRTLRSETLAAPFAVLEGTDGSVFVSDPLAKGIFRVTPGGEWVRIAREGSGPGEVRLFAGLGWRADTLVSPDPASRSLVLFDSSGTFLEELRVELPPSTPARPESQAMPVLLLPDGGILTIPLVFAGAHEPGRTAPYGRLDREGPGFDTLMLRDISGTHVRVNVRSSVPVNSPEHFLARPTVAIDLRGEIMVRVREVERGLELTWLRLSTGERTVLEIDVEKPQLERAEVEQVLSRWARANAERRGIMPAALLSALRDAVTVPPTKPLFTEAAAASGGHVWLRGFSTSDRVVWTRYSLDGSRPLVVRLRARDEVKDVGEDWMWIVRRDDFDIPTLIKIRSSTSG